MRRLGGPGSGLDACLAFYLERHFPPWQTGRPTLIGEWGGHWDVNTHKRLLGEWHTGLWMGLTSRDMWQRLNAVYYAGDTRYMRDADNLEGLTAVEAEMCRAHLPPGGSVLVAGAGGGREIWALAQAGYRAEGFECNEALVAYGNDFLQRHAVDGRTGRIHLALPDVCPDLGSQYDAVLIGWGVYIHVSPSPARVAFLEQVKRVLKPGGRIIVGFCDRTPHAASFRHIDAIARRFNRDVELGDKLEPTFEPERPGEIRRSCLDATAARKALGWEAQTALADGLQRTLAA